MNTPETSIKDSLSNSHQGAVMSVLGGFGDRIKSLFSEPAKNLSTVVSRLGVGPAALGIAALVALAAAAPGQAQAQNMWSGVHGGGGGYVTNNNLNDVMQQQRQTDFANQAARVIAEQRGLNQSQQNLAGLAALAAGAFTKDEKAPIAAAVFGAGAAMLIPNQNANQNQWGSNSNSGSGSMRAGVQGNNNGGYYNQSSYQQQPQVNVQSQAIQQAFGRYQQLAEPQFQIAVQANLDGNYPVRDKAIATFGQHWNAASQMGLPLHNNPDQVAKFQMLGRMNGQALNYGLQTRAGQGQVNNGYGLQ